MAVLLTFDEEQPGTGLGAGDSGIGMDAKGGEHEN